jgi:hypothetical protein
MTERESWPSRALSALLLAALLLGFLRFTRQFHVPAHAGADQNAYLVGGKMLVSHLTPRHVPHDDYAFVGRMWVRAADGAYYPKYPPGLPALYAAVYGLAGPAAAHAVNPLLMAAALVACYAIARQVAGPFAGILGTAMLATSPVTLTLANNPNSHAAALCLSTWGMFLLIRWWERAGFGRAAVAGTLLGLAATVRYTEALLLLPLLLVLLFNLHWRRGQSWGQAATLLACWSAPTALVLLSNRLTVDHWTAYGPTNESAPGAAFRWDYLAQNWETVLRQLNGTGLFFVLPIGALGLLLLVARSARLALVLWAWLLPGVFLYASYYWLAQDDVRFSYTRFFLTTFPPVVVGAAWILTRPFPTAAAASSRAGPILPRIVAPLAALLIVCGAGAYNVYTALPILTADHRRSNTVAEAASRLRAADVPADAVIFGPIPLLNHLQFATHHRLYATDDFDPVTLKALDQPDPAEPTTLDPGRANAQRALWPPDLPPDRFRTVLRDLTAKAHQAGHRVFVVTPTATGAGVPLNFTDPAHNRLDAHAFTATTLSEWPEPAPLLKLNRRRLHPDDVAGKWRLIEITPAPRTPTTTTSPATRPAP